MDRARLSMVVGLGVAVLVGLMTFMMISSSGSAPVDVPVEAGGDTSSFAPMLVVILAAVIAPLVSVFAARRAENGAGGGSLDGRRLALKIGVVLFVLLALGVFMMAEVSVTPAGENVSPEAARSNLTMIIMILNAVLIVVLALVMFFVRRVRDPRKRKNEDIDAIYTINELDEVTLGDDGELIYVDEKDKRADEHES